MSYYRSRARALSEHLARSSLDLSLVVDSCAA
jgi:hypothetical protein